MMIVRISIISSTSDSSLTVAQQICTSPSVGSNVQVNLSNSENVGYHAQYYLNTARPASCNGTISSVDYCYYGPNQYSSNSGTGYWVAVVALYRLQSNGSYSRVSNRSMLLLKRDDPRSSDRILLNFNCDTYVPRSTMRVQEGDVFGALLFTDQIQQFIPSWTPVRAHGLDLVGDSSDGYLMMNRTLNQDEIRNLDEEIVRSIISNDDGISLPSILDGLTLDTETRILHVYANISKPANLLHALIYESINDYCVSINFIAPDSDPTDIDTTPSRTSNISIPSSQPSISTQSTATSIIPEKPVTEKEVSDDNKISTQSPEISIGGTSLMGMTIAAVLGVIAIVGVLLGAGIAILLAILHRKQHWVPTTNLNHNEAKERRTSDASKVSLELNAAYMVKSPIETTRNVAYQNTSECHEYDYIENYH